MSILQGKEIRFLLLLFFLSKLNGQSSKLKPEPIPPRTASGVARAGIRKKKTFLDKKKKRRKKEQHRNHWITLGVCAGGGAAGTDQSQGTAAVVHPRQEPVPVPRAQDLVPQRRRAGPRARLHHAAVQGRRPARRFPRRNVSFFFLFFLFKQR